MAFAAHASTAEELFGEAEEILAQIQANDLKVAESLDRELREVFVLLQRELRYRELAGVLRIDFAAASSKAARRRALQRLETWKADANAALRAPSGGLTALEQAARNLSEMDVLLDLSATHWDEMVRRISAGEGVFTAEQIAQAKQLSRDTAFFRRRFGSTRAFLEEQGAEASFGKIENMAAMVEHSHRQARNIVELITRGAPLTGGRATESTAEDVAEAAATIRLDRNRLLPSSVAHARGLYSSALIRIAQALGIFHFMHWVVKPERPPADSGGVTRREMFQVRLGIIEGGALDLAGFGERVASALGRDPDQVMREARVRAARGRPGVDRPAPVRDVRRALGRMLAEEEPVQSWPEVFRRASRDRQLQVAWASNLPIHPGSKEFYLPIPPAMVEEARAWAKGTRRAA